MRWTAGGGLKIRVCPAAADSLKFRREHLLAEREDGSIFTDHEVRAAFASRR